jgi:hypothetical protein
MAPSTPRVLADLDRDLAFQDIRLVEAKAKQSLKVGPFPTKTKVAAMLQLKRVESEQEKFVRFYPVLMIESRYENGGAEDGVSIMARYQVTYKAISLRNATEEALTEFGASEVMPIIWPYWQAFVADILGRMSLPFLRIEPFTQTIVTRGQPPAEVQALAMPLAEAQKPKRARKKIKKG